MIRLIFVALFLLLFFIFTLPAALIFWIMEKRKPHSADNASRRLIQWAAKVVLWLSGVKLTVLGLENIPSDTPVMYAPNHLGLFDVVITYPYCKSPTGYIAKDSLAKVPFLSYWMRRICCLFLNRKNTKEGLKTILTGIEYIKNGISMYVFPEGTRNKNPEKGLLPFKEGSFKLAEKTACPIIPVAITGTDEIFENHLPWIKSTRVILQYGEPIILQDLDKEQRKFVGAHTRSQIKEMLKEHKALLG